MKNAAVLVLVLAFVACSSTAVNDTRTLRCGPGRDIEIRAGLDGDAMTREVMGRAQYLVEIANNAGEEVTVKSLRIDAQGENGLGVPSVFEEFDQVIQPGDAHVFEVPITEIGSGPFGSMASGTRMQFVVRVGLSNGDVYHCSFEAYWR